MRLFPNSSWTPAGHGFISVGLFNMRLPNAALESGKSPSQCSTPHTSQQLAGEKIPPLVSLSHFPRRCPKFRRSYCRHVSVPLPLAPGLVTGSLCPRAKKHVWRPSRRMCTRRVTVMSRVCVTLMCAKAIHVCRLPQAALNVGSQHFLFICPSGTVFGFETKTRNGLALLKITS
jgi:hypothetical protein